MKKKKEAALKIPSFQMKTLALFISAISVLIYVVYGVASFNSYVETKFANKEKTESQIRSLQDSIYEIRDDVKEIRNKADQIFEKVNRK